MQRLGQAWSRLGRCAATYWGRWSWDSLDAVPTRVAQCSNYKTWQLLLNNLALHDQRNTRSVAGCDRGRVF
jgi:hypothetical protein